MDNDLIFDHKPSTEEALRLAGFKSYYDIRKFVRTMPNYRTLQSEGCEFVTYRIVGQTSKYAYTPLFIIKK